MSGPRAGSIPEDDPLRGMVMFRTGELMKGPRKGIAKRFQFKLSEGFAVTRAKISQLMTEAEFGRNPEVIEDENIFFKGTKNARQQDFKALSTTNFGELLRRRWACITEVFVYLAPVAKPTDGIRRATADRVRAAAAEIAALQAQGNERLGPIATHHLAIYYARQPEGAALVVPDDNTMEQARALDAAAEAIREADHEPDHNMVEIEVELFGAWPDAMMPQGEDIPDTDHDMQEH
ncbi:hypothetical protein PI124_g8083 [Phytophthora idaei]|nr:hypothetical protein PI125_g10374 [Phytophthora idaei]KAG3148790.1 hypothetical protein PI126_g12323 [Phytophthora idaei]KAG3247216.1 hypothetical protein PI124_g8083 [Phytophthora idaei]